MRLLPGYENMSREHELTVLWQRYQQRWINRNDRMARIDQVVRGDWTVLAPDEEEMDPKSPNLIKVALDDTGESAASFVPTVRVTPSGTSKGAKESAAVMEQLGASYMERSEWPLLSIKSLKQLLAYGMFAWTVTWTKEHGPRIEWRDPRTCYPEPDFSTLGATKRCFFARNVYVTQLPPEWRAKFYEDSLHRGIDQTVWDDLKITLLEYYDDERLTIGACYDSNTVNVGGVDRTPDQPSYITVLFEDGEHPLGVPPVVIGQLIDLDPEPRGLFDQVITVLQAHFDLMALIIDYADQSVYSDVWVRDLVGEMSIGGGSYIQLGPQGQIGRVQPAVQSFSLFNEMQGLLDAVHIGARWPKSRMGEIDQAIASGKFIESTVGVMNQVVSTCHKITQVALSRALDLCFLADKKIGPKRTVAGVLRNQQFLMERKADDIDLEAKVRVEYGLGLGRDAAQSMVIAIQGLQTGLYSLEYVQENFPGINDVALERRRLDVQQFRDMMMAQLLQGIQEKSIPPGDLVRMAKARSEGRDLIELFDEFIVKPMEERQSQMLDSGLPGGDQMMPGMPPPAPGGTAPMPPPPEELMAMLGGGMAREEPETIARNSIQLGDGSFLGAQS